MSRRTVCTFGMFRDNQSHGPPPDTPLEKAIAIAIALACIAIVGMGGGLVLAILVIIVIGIFQGVSQ